MMTMLRSRHLIYQTALFLSIVILVLIALRTSAVQDSFSRFKTNHIDTIINDNKNESPHPSYKPAPSYTPPPVSDPFPALATSTPPPIPSYNVPEKDGWKKYGLSVAPPLIIGFTRSWPMLLQTVVSYITAGWPPEQIFVVENTGMQQANARGQLSLQHPWYLNHTALAKLGIHIIQTPVLLSFAQLQNFYLSLSYAHDWPYYFWSHSKCHPLANYSTVTFYHGQVKATTA